MITNRKSVLIFDDDETILEVCMFILQEKGWAVHTCEDVRNVLGVTADVNPAVILMDNWIPDTDGIVATRKLKASATLRDIPVVYFSANRDVKSLAVSAGADFFVEKPFDLLRLVEVLEEAYTAAGNHDDRIVTNTA